MPIDFKLKLLRQEVKRKLDFYFGLVQLYDTCDMSAQLF